MACSLIEYPAAFDQAGKLYHQLPGKEILYVIPIPFLKTTNCACWRHSQTLGPSLIDTVAPIILTDTLLEQILLPDVEMAAPCIL